MRAIALLAVAALLFAGCSTTSDGGPATTTGKTGTSKPPAECQTGPGRCTTTTQSSGPSTGPGTGTSGSSSTSGQASSQPPDDGNGTAAPPRAWASLADATIRPGVQTYVDLDANTQAQCTSNFLFTSPDNQTVYLGVAAHCFNDGGDAAGLSYPGCDRINVPMKLGTKVEVEGASDPAVLVYTSWGTMQSNNETDVQTCDANDFALVQLSAADAQMANPAMLGYGGPTGLAAPEDLRPDDRVLTFGNSYLRQGLAREKEGYIFSVSHWTTSIYTVTPGVEGDSGSAVILASGPAVGAMVTLQSMPPAANGVTNLKPALDYAREHAGLDVRLATWDVLDPGLLPPI